MKTKKRLANNYTPTGDNKIKLVVDNYFSDNKKHPFGCFLLTILRHSITSYAESQEVN